MLHPLLIVGALGALYWFFVRKGTPTPPPGVTGKPYRQGPVKASSGTDYYTDQWPPSAADEVFMFAYIAAMPDNYIGFYRNRATGKSRFWKAHIADRYNEQERLALLVHMKKDWGMA